MRLALLILLATFSFAIARTASANPVSFKGGYGIMNSYSADRFDLELNYSPTNYYALGVSTINILNYDDGTPHFQFGQFNYLIQRWNELESQANVYISLGVGAEQLSGDNSLASLIALGGDYETRRVYTSLLAETLQSTGSADFNRLRYRAGVAPYLTDFESLHTWIIAQVEYTPELRDTFTVTPLLRFFYDNLAFEIGASVNGDIYLGSMFHF